MPPAKLPNSSDLDIVLSLMCAPWLQLINWSAQCKMKPTRAGENPNVIEMHDRRDRLDRLRNARRKQRIRARHRQDRPHRVNDRATGFDRTEIKAAVDLYMKEHGDTVAGKKIQVILRDLASKPDNTKRLAQELIVDDKVNIIAGFEITPAALAVAPLATEAKVVELVMAAGTAIITERSPYIVRTSFTVPQSAVIIADWAAKNNIKKVVTIVSDYAPGFDAEKSFTERFLAAGGTVAEAIRVPLANPDFAPFLQRAADVKPDAIFVFIPSGQGGSFMNQFAERGLDKAGIKLIGTGDVV